MIDPAPLATTFKLASVTTAVLFVTGLPLAWWINSRRSKVSSLVETLVTMPLVLPPTVLGFYLLLALSPKGIIGSAVQYLFDTRIAFTFTGLVLGSCVFSLPFMVGSLKNGFAAVPRELTEAAETLGKHPVVALVRVVLPNMKGAMLTGCVMTFAHTVGEFGVVLMLGGNIPGTRVASIAVYEEVEKLNYADAHVYSLILFAVSFLVLTLVSRLNGGAFAGGRS